jgi:hypothetical protein
MAYLDTDVVIDVIRQYPPALAWLKSLGSEPVVLSGFVAMELYQGCQDKSEHSRVERALKNCQIVWASDSTCKLALSAYIAHHLSSGIGILDVLIGQTSIDLRLTLFTFNAKHYQVIPGIDVKTPYHRTP